MIAHASAYHSVPGADTARGTADSVVRSGEEEHTGRVVPVFTIGYLWIMPGTGGVGEDGLRACQFWQRAAYMHGAATWYHIQGMVVVQPM